MKEKNKISDLNNHLFAQLERLSKGDIEPEALEQEVTRTNAIVSVSEQIINNAKLSLDCAELVARHGVGKWEDMLPVVQGKPKSAGIPDYRNEVIK